MSETSASLSLRDPVPVVNPTSMVWDPVRVYRYISFPGPTAWSSPPRFRSLVRKRISPPMKVFAEKEIKLVFRMLRAPGIKVDPEEVPMMLEKLTSPKPEPLMVKELDSRV